MKCIIAGAAHLPGMLAAKTTIPILGVPVNSRYLKGMDSLLSIVQMPKGIPVATFAIGEADAANAGLYAASILSVEDNAIADKLQAFRKKQAQAVLRWNYPVSIVPLVPKYINFYHVGRIYSPVMTLV